MALHTYGTGVAAVIMWLPLAPLVRWLVLSLRRLSPPPAWLMLWLCLCWPVWSSQPALVGQPSRAVCVATQSSSPRWCGEPHECP